MRVRIAAGRSDRRSDRGAKDGREPGTRTGEREAARARPPAGREPAPRAAVYGKVIDPKASPVL